MHPTYNLVPELPDHLKQNLFQGLDRMSKNEGRIYKVIDVRGKYTFFKAEGFWSSVYHFFCTARMDRTDLRSLNDRVAQEINSHPNNIRLNALIEATYHEVLRSVKTNSTLFFPKGDILLFLKEYPHFTLIRNAFEKLIFGYKITSEELSLFNPDTIFDLNYILNSFNHEIRLPIRETYRAVEKISENQELNNYFTEKPLGDIENVELIRELLKTSVYLMHPKEIQSIKKAQILLDSLKNQFHTLDLSSFDMIPALKYLYNVCDLAQYIKHPDGAINLFSSMSSSFEGTSEEISSSEEVSLKEIKPIDSISADEQLITLIQNKFSNLFSKSAIQPEINIDLNDEEKAFLIQFLNQEELPSYFCCENEEMSFKIFCMKLGEELKKEALRIEHNINEKDMSPVDLTSWKDTPPSHLFFALEGFSSAGKEIYSFYDLSPEDETAEELPHLQKIFKQDWLAPLTRVPYRLSVWFDFIRFCQFNQIEVNSYEHLGGAFRSMVFHKETSPKKEIVGKNPITEADWEDFKSICNKNNITVTDSDNKKIFISFAMEELINKIVEKERNGFDSSIIEPYQRGVWEDPIIQKLTLPDKNSIKVKNYNLWGKKMHCAAIYLWNGLKDAKIISSKPSEALLNAAKKEDIELRK